MFKFLRAVFYFFTPYVSPFERKVDKFFRNIKSTTSHLEVIGDLKKLMQVDLVVVSVWLERKYKGYRYLKKRVRRKMYANRDLIVRKFEEFCVAGEYKERDEKLRYLQQIAAFLRVGGNYEYIETSSFGKLLRDPEKTKMEGDCNQIVTFYIYLYSLKFPVEDLNIKILPGHVCLNFRGGDIECTNGEFVRHEGGEVLPITEIVSTNLLDLTDFRESVVKIAERDMVKSAQLAYAISSMKEVVSQNLMAAYHNLAIACLGADDFSGALFYADKSGDEQMRQAVYSRQYNNLVQRVAGVKTVEEGRKYKAVYREMLDLARKMGDLDREKGAREVLGKLG